MTFKLPDLPYDVNSLEPHIDSKTMGIHHGKHHQAYINNLNAALEGNSELADKTALELFNFALPLLFLGGWFNAFL